MSQPTSASVIDQVRSTMSVAMLQILGRGIKEVEARRIAEAQATKLLELLGITSPSVDIEMLAELPDIEVTVLPNLPGLPLSGLTTLSGGRWKIRINATDSLWRCRATLAHEFKHILDDPFRLELYPGWGSKHIGEYAPAERICDYFAGCVLVPTAWLRRAWARGLRSPRELADMFAVSEALLRTRLRQVLSIEEIGAYGRNEKQGRLSLHAPQLATIKRGGSYAHKPINVCA